MRFWKRLQHELTPPATPDPRVILRQLSRDDDSVLAPSLRPVFSALRHRDFTVLDVHVHAGSDNGFEVLLSQEIDSQLLAQLTIPDGVEVYEDCGSDGEVLGHGFLDAETGQCINGP